MTDKALLIQALRSCALKLEGCTVIHEYQPEFAAEAVREYRLLADLCEGRDDCAKTAEDHS